VTRSKLSENKSRCNGEIADNGGKRIGEMGKRDLRCECGDNEEGNERERRDEGVPRRDTPPHVSFSEVNAVSTPIDSEKILKEKVMERNKQTILLAMLKEERKIRLVSEKRTKEMMKRRKEKRKFEVMSRKEMVQFNKKSMEYEGQYIEDYGTHFFCNYLPPQYFTDGLRYDISPSQHPSSSVSTSSAPLPSSSSSSTYPKSKPKGAAKTDVLNRLPKRKTKSRFSASDTSFPHPPFPLHLRCSTLPPRCYVPLPAA
jgi:hypothetical protein